MEHSGSRSPHRGRSAIADDSLLADCDVQCLFECSSQSAAAGVWWSYPKHGIGNNETRFPAAMHFWMQFASIKMPAKPPPIVPLLHPSSPMHNTQLCLVTAGQSSCQLAGCRASPDRTGQPRHEAGSAGCSPAPGDATCFLSLTSHPNLELSELLCTGRHTHIHIQHRKGLVSAACRWTHLPTEGNSLPVLKSRTQVYRRWGLSSV